MIWVKNPVSAIYIYIHLPDSPPLCVFTVIMRKINNVFVALTPKVLPLRRWFKFLVVKWFKVNSYS